MMIYQTVVVVEEWVDDMIKHYLIVGCYTKKKEINQWEDLIEIERQTVIRD